MSLQEGSIKLPIFHQTLGMSILELKQRISRLSQKERHELQTYLIRLKHDTSAAKRKTAKTIREMKKGQHTTIEELESRLGRS